MKALKCFTVAVLLVSGAIAEVYAEAPSYIKSFSLYAQESGIKSFFRAVYYLVMFILILAAAYYLTKFLAKRGMIQGKTKTMKVLESMPLGPDKSLHLIRVGSQFFLIGSASKNMFLISELDEEKLYKNQELDIYNLEDIEIDSYEEDMQSKSFENYLGSVKQNLHKLKSIVRGSQDNEK